MFISNGMVCGGEPPAQIKIVNAKPLENRMMILTFNSGEERLFDSTVLTGPVYEPLEITEIFNSVAIEHEVVTWKNGDIDCAPEFMYEIVIGTQVL